MFYQPYYFRQLPGKGRGYMAKATQSEALAVVDDADEMLSVLRGETLPEIEDPEKIAADIRERILGATNAEEILGGMRASGAKENIGRPFTLTGLKLMKSAHDKGLPVFAVLDATWLDNGEQEAVTCGASNVVTQAVQLFRIGALPLDVKFGEKPVASDAGRSVLFLEAA